MSAPAPIPPVTVGVFDSGVGGLSVLRELQRQLPLAHLVYVADSGHAPYGERSTGYVIERSTHIARFLLQRGARVLVVACNTATAAAAQVLRDAYPDTPIVGVEPGLKPAVALTRNRRIGVLATEGTLASAKFQALLARLRERAAFHLQPCPGLAHAIESGNPEAPEVLALVERYCAPLRAHDVDTVVLGCTHYPFVAAAIQRAMGPQVQLVDTAQAVARHTVTQAQKMLDSLPAVPEPAARPRHVEAHTSGAVDHLARITARWLDFPVQVQAWA
ncbi:glutamate racemase [Caldimonas thermodepolymerans]|jgi:glutamate racemase|uniref:Glutamate racemase n=1 Tax=Caldimonas thermodepolymerans TaxID=215580 RepID=A0A2S5T689_9BURK|nr:glutamate racemase [Caldimonas thermodepolymerans]PPE70387.1 glutamate racemase [Caldimonas thermodepolymerans]QPC30293.1 glutamate racemase [Caldimonas thermodepolymerans]RDI00689.1 glutamate racemase [Caldimonas thermodepolymerans]TCP07032.1 glutamate racemase [Caldimonas thermodepolymerans]UZG43055.1 glutamate racemase [Caldimonas thermodepolymerans]